MERVALVTVGDRGIGWSIAPALGADGRAVAVADIIRDEAKETAAAIEAGKDDPEKIRQFLARSKVETFGGTHRVNTAQQTGMPHLGTPWQNGKKKKIIWPAENATAEIAVPRGNWL